MTLPMQSGGSSGGVSGCSEDNERRDSNSQRKPYHRHTPQQIQRLEGFFEKCAHPDEKERRKLGRELGLEPKQIKFWFQNKRTQAKAQTERADNTTLRNENERFRKENIAMEESLRNATCGTCGPCGGPLVTAEKNQMRQKLEQENTELKSEYQKLTSILENYTGTPLSMPRCQVPGNVTAREASGNIDRKNQDFADRMKANPELEKLLMMETAVSATNQLIKLLVVDEPLWTKSPIEEQHVLNYDCYYKTVSETKECRYPNSRMESSKDSGLIAADAKFLVDLYLNPDKWVDLFPTLFSKARTIGVLKEGSFETRSRELQLVHLEMHVLSPLMPQREFYLLRYCQQFGTGKWVISDVSYDCTSHVFPTCWKYPSGCYIEEMPEGLSRVTCVEHVELDDNILVHPIYEDLVKSTLAFGAKRWLAILQRTCDRYTSLKDAGICDDQLGRGRRNMIKLASKMIKSYCSIFNQKSELTNNGVQINTHANTSPDQPAGTAIQAASSFWVPASPKRVFSFLTDHSMRAQWDIFCNGSQVFEIMQIPTGSCSSNRISILQPLHPCEDVMIFQESGMDQLGSYIVYAPINTRNMFDLATGTSSTGVVILASGFAITPDGPDRKAAPSTSTRKPGSGGSVITAAFQIQACSSLSPQEVTMEMVQAADEFVSRVVRVLESIFGCSG